MGREIGGRFKREGIYVYLWLIHVEVWQKTAKLCKQLKKKRDCITTCCTCTQFHPLKWGISTVSSMLWSSQNSVLGCLSQCIFILQYTWIWLKLQLYLSVFYIQWFLKNITIVFHNNSVILTARIIHKVSKI